MTSCSSLFHPNKSKQKPTGNLYRKIQSFSKKGIAVGHQDATAYGVGWKLSSENQFKSDMEEVTGFFPAIYGWDVGNIELGKKQNLDGVAFDFIRKEIINIHKKGGINTISWHIHNPETKGNSWDTTTVVPSILKGGKNHMIYEKWVAKLAIFFKSLKTEDNESIPIIFRPFHEMNGNWFWWGAAHCTTEEYKALYRQTFQLLKEQGVDNLLYAYSPNTLKTPEEYEKYYPGDEYVDILGIDIYNYGGDDLYQKNLQQGITLMRDFAMVHGKPYALTETGNMYPENPKWWTEVFEPGIKDSGISWFLLWRNAKPSHYFAPYPGEASAKNFSEFAENMQLLFLNDLKKFKVTAK
nr:glycosyl hydrolase [Mesonia sp.]